MKAKQNVIPFPNYKSEADLEAHPLFAVSEVELVYITKEKLSERPKISSSKDTFNILKSVWDDNKIDMIEQFHLLLLNRANRVLGVYQMSSGGLTGTVADIRLAFAAALKANAVGIVLSHNHPSGNLQPSRADTQLTEKFTQAGKFLDIMVLDHVIMSRDKYFSFADDGLL